MSSRHLLVLSALIGAFPLVLLGALDAALEILHAPEIPLRIHNVLLTLVGFMAVVAVAWVLQAHVYARGVEMGQRLERHQWRDGPTGEVVVPMRHRRPSPSPRPRSRVHETM